VIAIPVIRRHLTSELLGRHIYLFGSGASAGAVLRRLAEAGAQEGTVVLAEDDEARVHAAALFRPVLRLGAVGTFASLAALALAEAIEGVEGAGLSATPVWPDRVDIGDATVGTSFMEVAAADRPDFVILGVSVDVRALAAAIGQAFDSNVLIAAWLNGLDRWSTAYAARGPAAVAGAVRFRPRGATPCREPSPGRA
jgi:BirA family biotin operon repressor/biotin-[acetyl-CoA-carboxylase] ligase